MGEVSPRARDLAPGRDALSSAPLAVPWRLSQGPGVRLWYPAHSRPRAGLRSSICTPHAAHALGEAEVGILSYAKTYSKSERLATSESRPFAPRRRWREKAPVEHSRGPHGGLRWSLQLTLKYVHRGKTFSFFFFFF